MFPAESSATRGGGAFGGPSARAGPAPANNAAHGVRNLFRSAFRNHPLVMVVLRYG
jgi:hypothetical protein